MNISMRVRWLCLSLIVLFVVVGLSIALATLARSHSQRQAAVSNQQVAQQAAVDAIRRRGGSAVLGRSSKPDLPPSVIGVDLSSAIVDVELMQTLGQFTGIERLKFDGGKFQTEDCSLLNKLSQLRSLSLAQTNVTDAHVSQIPLGLTHLSLNGTSITDKSMSHLAAMNGLTILDIAETDVTSDGLRLIEPLRSLKTLWIDESCITAESAHSLRLMPLQNVEIVVSAGVGRRAHECLAICKRPNFTGRHRNGYILWDANSAWTDTLAGVVEAVVSEIGLDAEQAGRLLDALKQGPLTEGWEPTTVKPLLTGGVFSMNAGDQDGPPKSVPDKVFELSSVDEFIRELQKRPQGLLKAGYSAMDYSAVCRFAKEKFTASDVPKLLAAMRGEEYSKTGGYLFHFGPFLLVQHGIDRPEVMAELDRLLAHKEFFVRANTIGAFSYGGARPFYSREEWVANKAADAFAVPRLLQICKDKDAFNHVGSNAWIVLTEIARRRPEYVAEILPVLVDALGGEPHFSWIRETGPYLSPIAEANVDVAVAVVPRLRAILKHFDLQLAGAPAAKSLNSPQQQRRFVLEALSATARVNPALANEIAIEYLGRMRAGQPAGPLPPLLSPDTPEANRRVVLELLGDTNIAPGELALVAKRIRDWSAKRPMDK